MATETYVKWMKKCAEHDETARTARMELRKLEDQKRVIDMKIREVEDVLFEASDKIAECHMRAIGTE